MFIRNCCFLVVLFITACNTHSQLGFTSIDNLNYVDTNSYGPEITQMGTFNFLVTGYKSHNGAEKRVDSFVTDFTNRLPISKFASLTIVIYRKSKITTVENIRKDKKIIDRYSNENDKIFEYVWHNGKFIGRFKYKGGKIIEPDSEITIQDPE